MRKKAIAALLTAVVLCSLWAAPAFAAVYATVMGGWLRLRANPSYDATVIASYKTGSIVTVLSQSGGWARVLTGDYRLGYMDQRYLYYSGSAPTPTAKPAARTWTTVNRTAWVTSQNGKGVRMRNAPEVNKYNVLGLYPVGRTVAELKVSNDGWSYIQIDGKYGYMMSRYLTTGGVLPPPPVTAPPVITNHPTATPSPTPAPTAFIPDGLSSVKLNTLNPLSGDQLKLTVKPAGIKYSVVWYRTDTKVLLSTANSYTVTDDDVGSAITVRVTASDGSTAEVTTNKVKAAVSTEVFFAPELPSEGEALTQEESIQALIEELDHSQEAAAVQQSIGESLSMGGGTEYNPGSEEIPDFVRRTLEQGDAVAEPAEPYAGIELEAF